VAPRERPLARGVGRARGIVDMPDAEEMAHALAYDLAKKAYKL
jgi:hypothetical protein